MILNSNLLSIRKSMQIKLRVYYVCRYVEQGDLNIPILVCVLYALRNVFSYVFVVFVKINLITINLITSLKKKKRNLVHFV